MGADFSLAHFRERDIILTEKVVMSALPKIQMLRALDGLPPDSLRIGAEFVTTYPDGWDAHFRPPL